MKALQKFCFSENCDLAGFVETAGRLCYEVHFAWLLHSVSFYWIFFNKVQVFTQRIFGGRNTLIKLAVCASQQLK